MISLWLWKVSRGTTWLVSWMFWCESESAAVCYCKKLQEAERKSSLLTGFLINHLIWLNYLQLHSAFLNLCRSKSDIRLSCVRVGLSKMSEDYLKCLVVYTTQRCLVYCHRSQETIFKNIHWRSWNQRLFELYIVFKLLRPDHYQNSCRIIFSFPLID